MEKLATKNLVKLECH